MKHNQNGFTHLLIAVSLVLAVVIAGAGFFVYRNVSEKPTVEVEQNLQISKEEISTNPEQKPILSGTFSDADAIHKGTGTANIIETDDGPILIFEDNFKTTNGPDLFVYLSPNPAGESLGDFASLGKLKSISGSQAYSLPENYKDYKTVVIWCRAFSTTFTTAELR